MNELNIFENEGVTYIPFRSPEPLTPFTAFWQYFIGERILSKINCDRLKEFLLSKQEEILEIKDDLNDGGTGLGNQSTTSRWLSYNVFQWDQEDLKILEEGIIKTHDIYYRLLVGKEPPEIEIPACWMNIMNKGERIKKHNHAFDEKSYLSGNFTVACEGSKTVYVNPMYHISEDELIEAFEKDGEEFGECFYASTNKTGNLTLFPCYVPHFTTEHTSDTERITIAFEIVPKGFGGISTKAPSG
tara:strand:+ start:50 stop:781 length:732 start_codon:yes stop_codon:yes gene_type:complete